MTKFLKILLIIVLFISLKGFSQQDHQYTQYMYNTMSINPAYVGSQGHTVITTLARKQWIGLKGEPNTQTLSFDSQIGSSRVGLGFNVVNDVIGPVHETYLDANISYTIKTHNSGNLSFGLKLGGHLLNIDWSKGLYYDKDDSSLQPINNKFLPQIGAGIYYYTSKWYIGLSAPNLMMNKYYDDSKKNNQVSLERMHLYLISGLVFDLSKNIKFKPTLLFKGVNGSPLSLDLSANFLFNNKFIAGFAYRLNDSISTLIGFQFNNAFQIGYSYDLTTSNNINYNSGTHELMLRYQIFKNGPLVVSPRFF